MAEDKDLKQIDQTLDGKLITGVDGCLITTSDFQVLKNMRYTDVCPKGIYGMTKINTTNHSTVKYIKSGIHYQKSQPAESHVLLQATDVNGANGIIKHSSAVVPGTADFNATTWYTEASGHSVGKFTIAPDDCVAYCNSKESLIWGGNEYRIGVCYNKDTNNTFMYDYTQILQEGVETNPATLYPSAAGTDLNTIGLLHLDNNVTDSESTPKTWTNVSSAVAFDSTIKIVNSHSARFISASQITTPAHSDFNFGANEFAIEFYVKTSTTTANYLIRQSASNYTDKSWGIYLNSNGTIMAVASSDGTANTVALTSTTAINNDVWSHIAFTRDGNLFTLFINGNIEATTTNALTLFTSSSVVTIGGATTSTTTQTFTANGTFTVPAGVNYVQIEAWGGGGGGGAAGTNVGNGAGGGGGGYGKQSFDVSPSTQYTVTVGSGGTGATYPTANGTNGGTTSVGSLISATGGVKGLSDTVGTGGTSAATYNIAGTAGSVGSGDYACAGGAGGNGGAGGAGTAYNVNATAGTVPGGGGGGGGNYIWGANGWGGAAGKVIVTCYDFAMHVDEIRISNTSRYTNAFTPTTTPFGLTASSNIYIGMPRMIQSIKCYVATANTNDGQVSGFYWNGNTWLSLTSLTDNTITGAKTLTKTGTITFTSTVGLAKTSFLQGNLAYWYLFCFDNLSTGTSLYKLTVDAPIQPIVDMWDGEFRKCLSAQKYASSIYNDFTPNIIDNEWVDGYADTYIDLNGLATSTDFLITGFPDKTCAVQFNIANGYSNSVASTILSEVSYWSGSAWVSVGTYIDGTRNSVTGTGSFSKSGSVTWSPISANQHPQSINNNLPLYYYKFRFNANLAVAIRLYGVLGIPQPETISGYKFPIMWQKRLGLCTNIIGKKNEILLSAPESVCTFNGTDSLKLNIGDNSEFTAAGSLFSRYGASIYESLVITKANAVFILDGNEPKNYTVYQTAENFGCPASETFKMCDMGYEVAVGLNKHVLIWQTSSGVVMFDGNSIIPISKDIKNLFDPNASDHINFAKLDKSTGFFDINQNEYHWCFMSGASTVINREFVYDVMRKKWFEIDRTSGKYVTCGFVAQDTTKRKYIYGGTDADNVYRLENGNDLDGTTMTYTLRTGDKPLSKSIMSESKIRAFKILMKVAG